MYGSDYMAMIKEGIFEDLSRVAVLGMGKTGQSMARFLMQEEIDVICMDDYIDLEDFNITQTWSSEIDVLFVSPGIPFDHQWVVRAQHESIPVLGDLDLFVMAYQRSQSTSKVLAITGTNGKSTLVSYVDQVLRSIGKTVAIAGNHDVPSVDVFDQSVDVILLEVSSFQLFYAQYFKADIGLITNLSEDHLDWHQTVAHYQEAKLKMACFSKHLLLPYENIPSCDHLNQSVFGTPEQREICAEFLSEDADCNVFLKGSHDQNNVLACMQLCVCLYPSYPFDWKKLCVNLKRLEHRCEILRGKKFIWVNDSKATNTHAVSFALRSLSNCFDQKMVLIMGGIFKEHDLVQLEPWISKCVHDVWLFGASADLFAQHLSVPSKQCVTLEEVVSRIMNTSYQAGMPIVFSPACASFDQFRDYKHRGNVFKSWVMEYDV